MPKLGMPNVDIAFKEKALKQYSVANMVSKCCY